MDKIDNNIEWKSFDKFQKAMLEILNEKFEKYTNTWKTCNYFYLKRQLYDRINNLGLTSDKTRRKLIHIANYCYFLYTRLGDK